MLVNAARLAGKIVAALPDELTPERTDGPRRLHPRLRDRGAAAARPTCARSCATSTTTSSPRTPRCCGAPPRRSSRAAPGARLEVDVTPQYPNMHRFIERVPAGDREGRGGAARRGHRAGPHADPRRHRRLTPERDGPADAEPVHGRPRLPLTAGVGVAAGDERGGGDGGAAGGGVGSRWSATPTMTSAMPSASRRPTAPA